MSNKNIPLVDLRAGFRPIKDEVMRTLEDVFESMHLHLGPNVEEFEKEFASFCGSKFAVGVGSGTEALNIALLSVGIKSGDEVITSSHTFFATAEAISNVGAIPVFVDIDPETFNIGASLIEKKVTPKTRAIIPVHLYGQASEMDKIMEIAKRYHLIVIEDACQAHGAEYHGRRCGAIGNAGCFSFYCTKNLGSYGEGGIIVTDDPELYEMAKKYRNHGHISKFEHCLMGLNGRLDEIQAAILRVKLRHLESYNNARRNIARRYSELLHDAPLILPVEAEGRRHVYHLYVIRSKERDALQAFLQSQGIGTGIHYKKPVHLQKACNKYGYKEGSLPVTEAVCDEILSFPMYPELSEEDILFITSKIREFYNNQ